MCCVCFCPRIDETMTDLGKQKLLRVINVDLTKVYILLMDTLLLSQLLIESDIVMQLFC